MDDADAELITSRGTERIKIRSVLNCRAKNGVCRKCYGASLANGKPVTVGDMQINCTSLMYGELPVSAVLDGDTNEPTEG